MEFPMDDDHEIPEYTEDERAMFAALPRTSALDPRVEDRIVAALRADGSLGIRGQRRNTRMLIAAGLVLFAIGGALGGIVGAARARAHSLEAMIARTDLSVP